MTHPSVTAAVAAGFLEPCVIMDGDGRELHGYRPTEMGRRYFGPDVDQSELVDVTNIIPFNR